MLVTVLIEGSNKTEILAASAKYFGGGKSWWFLFCFHESIYLKCYVLFAFVCPVYMIHLFLIDRFFLKWCHANRKWLRNKIIWSSKISRSKNIFRGNKKGFGLVWCSERRFGVCKAYIANCLILAQKKVPIKALNWSYCFLLWARLDCAIYNLEMFPSWKVSRTVVGTVLILKKEHYLSW